MEKLLKTSTIFNYSSVMQFLSQQILGVYENYTFIYLIYIYFIHLDNADIQNKELEEEVKKEVERRYQEEMTRELGKIHSKD